MNRIYRFAIVWISTIFNVKLHYFLSREGYPELIKSDKIVNFTASKKTSFWGNVNIDSKYIAQQWSNENKFWKEDPKLAPRFGCVWDPITQTSFYVSSDCSCEQPSTRNHFILRWSHLALAPLTAKIKISRTQDFKYTQNPKVFQPFLERILGILHITPYRQMITERTIWNPSRQALYFGF